MANQKSFLNAIKWSYASSWGEKAFSSLFTFVLAAVLGPREFGMVSIAVVYVAFLQMFLDQGLMAALVQRKDLESDHLDAVFWMDLVLSFFLVGLSVLFSRWWATLNHAPEAAMVISVLSLCIPIEGLAIIQRTLLSREMDFKSLSIRSNVSVVVGGITGVGMAYAGMGVWALVGQQIVRDLAALMLLWKLSSWRPRFRFSWLHLKDLMGFSLSNFIAQLGIFADGQTGSILLGLFLGPLAVGLYRLADRLVGTVVTMATSSIQAVSLPEFSRLQDKPDELRQSALACIRLSSSATVPGLALLAAVSGPLVATIGPQWTPASGVLKVLCVSGMTVVFAFFTGPLLQALSRPHQLALLEWARTALGIVLLLAAGVLIRNMPMNRQIMGIALTRLLTVALFITPAFLYILIRLTGISLRDLVSSVVPSGAASAIVVVAVSLFQFSGWLSSVPAISLVAEALIGGIAGLSVLLLLDVQLRKAVFRMVKKILGVDTMAKTVA